MIIASSTPQTAYSSLPCANIGPTTSIFQIEVHTLFFGRNSPFSPSLPIRTITELVCSGENVGFFFDMLLLISRLCRLSLLLVVFWMKKAACLAQLVFVLTAIQFFNNYINVAVIVMITIFK